MKIDAFIILTAIFALGLDAISYKYYATSAYWPVGEILDKDGSWLHALGFFAILYPLLESHFTLDLGGMLSSLSLRAS